MRWSNWVTPFSRAFLSAFAPKLNCLNSIFSISSCKSTSAKPAGKFSTHIQIQLTNYHFSKLLNKNQTFIPAISKINPKYANAILGCVSSVKCCLSSNQLCCHLSTVTVWPQTLAHKKQNKNKCPPKAKRLSGLQGGRVLCDSNNYCFHSWCFCHIFPKLSLYKNGKVAQNKQNHELFLTGAADFSIKSVDLSTLVVKNICVWFLFLNRRIPNSFSCQKFDLN